jgi:ribosome biogenesis GTPase / thiamine phosphate phosphatase
LSELELGALGWSDELAASLEPGCVPGRVVAAHRAAFDVAIGRGAAAAVVRSRLPGRLAHFEAVDVAVGDWVGLRDGLIRSVLPRRSALVRSAAGLTSESQTLAANVDVAFVVTSFGPDLEPRRLERYLVTVWESGASPEIVLTKADRFEAAELAAMVAAVEAVAIGVPVWVVSAVTGLGVDDVRARVGIGRTAVLVGSSGVGKSTLVNRWLGSEVLATRETRADDDEGRHTTTRRELLLLPGGGVVIDTPGIRELQLCDAGASGALEDAFADVEELAATCRFSDCAHGVEPGCAVQAALREGSLPRDRYASWQKLQRELRAIAIRADARLRKEERKRWHQVTKEAHARTRRR